MSTEIDPSSTPTVAPYFAPFVLFRPVQALSWPAVQAYLRAARERRWSLRATRWSTSLPVPVVERELRQRYDPEDPDQRHEEVRWTGTGSRFGIPLRVRLLTAGDIVVDTYLPGIARLVLLGAIIAGLLTAALAPSVALGLYAVGGIVLAIGLPTATPKPLPDQQSRRVAYQTTAIPGLAMLMAVLAALVAADLNPVFPVFGVAFLFLVGAQLILLYLDNALPGINTGMGETALYIPLFGMIQVVLALVVFFVVQGLFAGHYILADAWMEFFLPGYTLAKSSIYADLTGQNVLPGGHVDRNLLMRGFFVNIADSLTTLLQFIFFWWAVSLLGAWRIKRSLLQNRLTSFGSYGRYVILGGTVAANIVILGGLLVAVDILAFGLLGWSLLPTAVYTPIVNTYVQKETVTGEQFLEAIYRTYSYVISDEAPIDTRLFAVALTGVIFRPLTTILVSTVGAICLRPLRVWLLLYRATPLDAYDVAPTVPEDIELRVVERDQTIDIRPLPVLFGMRKYVVMTDRVVEELSENQLEALLRHEEYHLRNREPSLLALLLSFTVGGRNALLAFHDYPTLERRADAYAAQKTDKQSLIGAIRQLSEEKRRRGPSAENIEIGSPGFIWTPPGVSVRTTLHELSESVRTVDRRGLRQQVRRVVYWVNSILSAPDDIFFGMVLYDAAHLTAQERIDRIEQLDESAPHD